jgi:hypothetical protein
MELQIQKFLRANPLASIEPAYQIAAKRHPLFSSLVMFKYAHTGSPMHEPIVRECRGIILDEANDWRVVSFPFKKFFNYGEPNAAAIDWSTATVYEKLDGSLMTLYWHAGEWRVASSGLPDAGGPAESYPGTFAELFWSVWNRLGYRLPGEAEDRGICLMFELVTPHNRIVVQYPTERIVLLGCRSVEERLGYREFPPTEFGRRHGWETVRTFPLKTIEDCVAAAGAFKGIEAEGFVVCDANFNRVKVKSPHYVALAFIKDSLSPRGMLDIIRKGESDEFLAYFPEIRPEWDRVRALFDGACAQIETEYASIKAMRSQKDFAAEALKLRCPSALFAIRSGKAKTAKDFFAGATPPAVERAVFGATPKDQA